MHCLYIIVFVVLLEGFCVASGCELRDEKRMYLFNDEDGNKIDTPYTMSNNERLTVNCKFESAYNYYVYDLVDLDNITCINGKLSEFTIKCPEEQPVLDPMKTCSEFKLPHGHVSRKRGNLLPICDPGYTLNMPEEFRNRSCKCVDGSLQCFANSVPKCRPDPCIIPWEVGSLSMYQIRKRTRSRVYLSSGIVVKNQDYIYFNCSSYGEHYEPANRRFKCDLGAWMEAERDPNWKLGYNGGFPQCREAVCAPKCQNRGTCYRDDQCRCPHLITGKRCETFLCDRRCTMNGGECVEPGKCGNCPIDRRGDNCEIQSCGIYDENNTHVYTNDDGSEITTPNTIWNGTSVTVNCRYKRYFLDDVSDTVMNITCMNGALSNESMECPDKPKTCENTTLLNGNIKKRNELFYFTCDHGYIINIPDAFNQQPFHCFDGKFINSEGLTLTPECVKGCEIPKDSKKFVYNDEEEKRFKPLDVVRNGTRLTVTCHYQTYFDYYDEAANSQNVTCVDGLLPELTLQCPDPPVDNCEEFKIQHGNVDSRFKYGEYMYNPSCNKGYTLNIREEFRSEPCKCDKDNGMVRCFAETVPTCEPDSCPIPAIPYDSDSHLSIYRINNGSRVHDSAGIIINHTEYAYFNCSSSNSEIYEPANRRFQCFLGEWIESDIDPNWKLGHNGTFPSCRKVRCDPVCENGGVCIRDNKCRCPEQIAGDRCQKFLCDERCTINGGQCIGRGKCGKCPFNQRGDNCEIERKPCDLPPNAATYKTDKKRFYPGASISASDMSCTENQILSSTKSMTCREDGTWTNVISCQDGTSYLIRLQVHDSVGAGTSDRVYYQIHGDREETGKRQLRGYFGRNRLVENVYTGRDLGSIQNVVVSKTSGTHDDFLLIPYVSIYIEAREEYYVFTYQDKSAMWITQRRPCDFTLSHRPEHCVHTYDNAVSGYPKINCSWRYSCFHNITLRECKQRCATTRYFNCGGVFFKPTNNGKGLGECRHISIANRHRYSTVNTRGYMFYKRKCLK